MSGADRYALAACAEPSAPTPRFAPFTAMIEQQEDGCFLALVLNSQGKPLHVGPRRWSNHVLALQDAEDARRLMLLRHKRAGECPALLDQLRRAE